jgi:hypothetical protein
MPLGCYQKPEVPIGVKIDRVPLVPAKSPLMAASPATDVFVLTEDGHSIRVPDELLPMITLVSQTAKISGGPSVTVPLPKIRGTTFAKVLEWTESHKMDEELFPRNKSNIRPANDQDRKGEETGVKLQIKNPKLNIDDDEFVFSEEPIVEDRKDSSGNADGDYYEDDYDEDIDERKNVIQYFNKMEFDKAVQLSPADRKLIDSLDIPNLIDLTAAANYLAMEHLLDICCKAIANHMTGLSVEELRLKFNIPNDFTPEEEATLKKEFGWADQ